MPEIKERINMVGLIFDAILALALFAVTALTIYPMFSGDFTQNWGSIESAFLSDAAFIVSNYPHVGWYPYWYGGLPFHLSYPPLLPYLVAGLHFLLNWSIGHAYRVVAGIAYAATPAALYALTRSISRSRVAALIAGLAYSLVPTFLPGLAPSHIEILSVYGEGPHVLALPFILLAIAQLLRCMKRPTMFGYLATVILTVSVALTNVIALFAFVLFSVLALVLEIVYGQPVRALRAFTLIALVSYGLVAFQYDLEFIQSSASFGAGGGVSFVGLLSSPFLPVLFISVLLIPGLLLILRQYLSKSDSTKSFFLGLMWLVVFGVIVLAKQLFEISLAPQPIRYVPEVDLSVSLVIGLLVAGAIGFILKLRPERSQSFKHGLRIGLTAFVLVALAFSGNALLLPISLRVTTPAASIADVTEFQMADWLSSHVNDERIYATGTVSYWLNVFSGVRQIRGGSEQGATNGWWAPATYEINLGRDAQLSVLWAQAWNVKYIVVTFPNATTAYRDYVYPEKFIGVLPLRYHYQGFGVYEVSLPQPALVQAVSAQAARSLRPISNVSDVNALSDYITLVDTAVLGTRVSYVQPSPDELSISVSNGSPDTAILVKITYDPSWEARLEDGATISLQQIGPDFMVAYPQKSGDYRLDLHFNRSTGQSLSCFITITTLLVVVLAKPIKKLHGLRKRKATKLG